MEATAKYDFKATADDELSFRKGDSLKILQTSGNWYRAELNRVQGFVPKNFINMPSWFQEASSRSDAQQILMSQPVGAFLIRGRQNADAAHFSISVRHPADVQHFKVLQDSRGQYYLWSHRFPSLNQLVEYYKSNSISIKSRIFLQETQTKQREASDDPSRLPADSVPPEPPEPPQFKSSMRVRALYDFQAEESDELEFSAGETIRVLDWSDRVWWTGQLGDKTGLFPSSYTKPI